MMQPCLGPDGCDGFYQDQAQTICNAPRRNNCGACGATDVPGIGASCSGPAGRSGIAVCSVDGTATTCATTVVSLTIDDTFSDATRARDAYEAHGIRATFFVNSPRFNFGDNYMTLDEVLDLQHRGHEVGGHTLDHPDLPTLTVEQQHVEICHDRAELLALGLDIKNFAYPFGANSDATQQTVRDCNYNTARQIGGISDGSQTYAEGFVPQNRWAMRTPTSLGMQNSLDDIKAYVTNAEAVGGWIIINMHHIVLDDGSDYNPLKSTTSMYQGTLTAFLDWLQPRAAQGTVTQTIRQMMWGATLPAVDWHATPPDGGNFLLNPSFETLDAGFPVCWETYGSGTNDTTWAAGTPHTGAVAESVAMDQYMSGARGMMSSHDYGACAPVPTPGHTYEVSAWYIAPENTPQFEIDYLTQGAWLTWVFSPRFPASATYTQATWVTPALPPDAERVSVGLMLRSIGTLTVDDLSFKDTQ
jgi:peptidoglycan/xylan/chitin deacetylase (PgdA/CDA1 family)